MARLTADPLDPPIPDPAPPRRQRSRWPVVAGMALAVLLCAEVAVRAVEGRLPPPPGWYTPEYGTKVRQMDDLSDRGGAPVVFIGSSVIDVSIDPSQLAAGDGDRPAYNAGLIGANLEMVDVWSEHVVEPTLRPEVVVIGISSRDVNRNGGGLETQTPGFYRLSAVRHLLGRESTVEWIERRLGELSHLVRYREVLRRPLESVFGYDAPDRNLTEVSDLGQELHLADLPYQSGPEVEAFFRREPLHQFAMSTTQFDHLRRAVERLRAAGARVVLLDVPVTAQYVALHPRRDADYRDYQIALNVLSAQTGAELVSAGIWPPEAFSDPLHLNGEGARLLTEVVEGYLAGAGVVLPAGAQAPEVFEGGVAQAVIVTAPG